MAFLFGENPENRRHETYCDCDCGKLGPPSRGRVGPLWWWSYPNKSTCQILWLRLTAFAWEYVSKISVLVGAPALIVMVGHHAKISSCSYKAWGVEMPGMNPYKPTP